MRIAVITLAVTLSASTALSQEQQAGNEASTNAEETFQALVDQCDNTDLLVMRGRIRLLLSRTTEEAAAEARRLMEDGFRKCGEGDMETAAAALQQAYDVADAGATERFGQDATPEVAAESEAPAEEAEAAAGEASDETKPWWQFW